MPRERIAAAQRERLLIGVTELIAARGYAAVSVSDVVARAQVSRAVFYGFFADKQECAVTAYDRFIEVLLTGLAATMRPQQDLTEFVDAALRAYITPMRDDPVVGRAFQVEIDAMGAPARRRRRESLQLFADALGDHHRQLAAAESELLAPSAYRGVVYAVRQLVSDEIEADNTAQLLELVPELSGWLMRMLTGEQQ
ncbi:TetR/AcrR family transcriptional regulator [Gordonia sp. DT30]|uniref:TetR/AcrR family transcriptional regulator n=1 Tax=Gordonia sp. DT30 TaxID=3416546 RepID=UPI003CEA7443